MRVAPTVYRPSLLAWFRPDYIEASAIEASACTSAAGRQHEDDARVRQGMFHVGNTHVRQGDESGSPRSGGIPATFAFDIRGRSPLADRNRPSMTAILGISAFYHDSAAA